MTTTFLDTCSFLTDHHKALLREADLDEPAAFQHLSESAFTAKFMKEPYLLSEGKVGRLYTATRLQITPVGPTKIEVSLPETLSRDEQIGKALRASKYDALRDLGVTHVVAPKGALDADATIELFAANPSRIPATWRGKKVVALSDLTGAERYRNPRNGSELQGLGVSGVDEVTGEPWGALGLDGLCVAAFGESAGFFTGMADAAVITAMKIDAQGARSPLRVRIEERMEAVGITIASLKDRVVVGANKPTGERSDGGSRMPAVTGRLLTDLSALFKALFDPGSLRRFLQGHNLTASVCSSIAWTGSEASVAHDVADTLIRYGIAKTPEFQTILIAERPRRAVEIAAVLGSA